MRAAVGAAPGDAATKWGAEERRGETCCYKAGLESGATKWGAEERRIMLYKAGLESGRGREEARRIVLLQSGATKWGAEERCGESC